MPAIAIKFVLVPPIQRMVTVKTTVKTFAMFLMPVLLLSAASAWAGDTPVTPAATPEPAPIASPVHVPRHYVVTSDMLPHERVLTWDMNFDGAAGKYFPDSGRSHWTGFGRVRAGVMYIHDLVYLSLGPTYEYSDLSSATFGLQGEAMHLEKGIWCQAGFLLDIAGRPGFMFAIGWSLLGLEVQEREFDQIGSGFSPIIYLKLRIPVGVIARIGK